MPEFTAPGLGRESNTVAVDLECSDRASGMLYTLGGSGGGLALYLDQGRLVYLYNMMIIEQCTIRAAAPLPGRHTITVDTTIDAPGGQGHVVVAVVGTEVGITDLKRTVPVAFTASESLDIGADLGWTVANEYFDRRPFDFYGRLHSAKVRLK